MNLNNIDPQAWRLFEARWPRAADYLRHESLRAELKDPKAELANGPHDPRRRIWITARVKELEGLFNGVVP